MTGIEITEIIKIAEDFWPKAVAIELGLLGKIIKPLTLSDAKTILEEARVESKYQSLPLKDISCRIRTFKPTLTGDMITCCALHTDTGKYLECVVLARTNDGAKTEMAKWLEKWGMNPTDYTLFVGDENYGLLRRESFQIRHQLFPEEKEKYYRFLAGLKKRGLLKGGAELAVYDPAALDGVMETATTEKLDIFQSVPAVPTTMEQMNEKVRQLMAAESECQ